MDICDQEEPKNKIKLEGFGKPIDVNIPFIRQGVKIKLRQIFQQSRATLEAILSDPSLLKKYNYDQQLLKDICQRNPNYETDFPGAQSVSFHFHHADDLQFNQTLICEKTDGVRFFLLDVELIYNKQGAEAEGEATCRVYFTVDRKYEIRQVLVLNSEKYLGQAGYDAPFSQASLTDFRIISLFDGELAQDFKAEREFEELPNYLVFDALVVNGENVMHMHFRERLLRANEYILDRHTVYQLRRLAL
mmetsp:Transcript_18432/g.31524  ORF Transcript_18432/g.31524 Transcript_18432/m.31524 type:complete len:247 (+) Transcript_18432:7-747(+)